MNTNQKFYLTQVQWATTLQIYLQVIRELYRTLPFDFLSEIVYQWERFANKFKQFGTRVVLGRFGLILSDDGGALEMMELPYRLYVGGKLGSGRQWYSWIHIDDLIRGILFTINHDNAEGPFNLTAPIPERQNLFGYTFSTCDA